MCERERERNGRRHHRDVPAGEVVERRLHALVGLSRQFQILPTACGNSLNLRKISLSSSKVFQWLLPPLPGHFQDTEDRSWPAAPAPPSSKPAPPGSSCRSARSRTRP